MDYASYSNETQPTFHQQHFNGYPDTTSQYGQGATTATHQQDPYQREAAYQQYDPSYHFANSANFNPTHPQQQPSPPLHHDSSDSHFHLNGARSASDVTNGDHSLEALEQDGDRSSSEEKGSLSPAQRRRKAQNRAAQRAFRERKERHVKDLENKLNSLSAHSTTLLNDNERLKREMQRLSTQNEILLATGAQPGSSLRSPSPIPGPQSFTPIDFQTAIGEGHRAVSFEDFGGVYGQRILAVGATWDFIMNHKDFKKGLVDIESVHRRLKGLAKCNGRGPAFREQDIIKAIEESTASGSGYELL